MRGTGVKNFRTKTTVFLLPLIAKPKNVLINEHFINAYISLSTSLEEEEFIYLKYTNGVVRHRISNITLRYFLKGDYHKFSKAEKLTILAFWNLDKNSKLHGILFPTTDVRRKRNLSRTLRSKLRYWPKPDTTYEALIHNV